MENKHVGAQKGTEIQIQLTRKVSPKRPNRLKPVRRAYTAGEVIMSGLTTVQKQDIQTNIYSAAHGAIADWDNFAWHYSNRTPDACVLHSSQAFCISVWGTFASPRGKVVRVVVASILQDRLLCKILEQRDSGLSLELESNQCELLNEHGQGHPSQFDGVLRLKGLIVVIESKLTEPLGTCSQVNQKDCSGIYGPGSDLKLNKTEFPCRLVYRDRSRTPRRYWEIMKPLSIEGAYPFGMPCPFAGGGYQVMRNIAAAAELARTSGIEWRVIFAYPRSTGAGADEAIELVKGKLVSEHQHRILKLDYSVLAERLMLSEEPTASGLGRHLMTRLPRSVIS